MKNGSTRPRSPFRRLLLLDPGLRRTYEAGRATVAVGGALAATYTMIRASGQPPVLAMVAVFVALQMSLRPTAPLPLQLRTEALGWVVSVAALTLGVLLAGHPPAAAVAFVLVMAVSTWASGFGPQGLTLGIVGFVTYLFTQFAHPPLADLPWLLLAATVGLVMASLVRNILLPRRPNRALAWLVRALRDETAALTAIHPAHPGKAPRLSAARVDAIVLQLHDVLDAHPSVVPDEQQFHRDLFAVVTLTHLFVLRLEGASGNQHAALLPPAADPGARLEVYLSGLEAAVDGIAPGDPGDREIQLEGERSFRPDPEKPRDDGQGQTPPEVWLTGPRRRAVQVAAAGLLSVAAGMYLSPERWYWAPMTAFFVFANANTRGATMRKAVERTLGTVGGIAGGLLLGSVLAGHTRLQLVAVFPLLFLGFWLLPVSYALMTVAITSLLALLYAMMAILTLDLLLLRLGETAIGAGIGVAVAYFFIPARTRGAVDDAMREFFAALETLFVGLATATEGRSELEAAVLLSVQRLDRATDNLNTTINPVSEAVPGRRARLLRQELILALTARYWAHRVAARVIFQPGMVQPGEIQRLMGTIQRRLAALQQGIGDTGEAPDPGSSGTAMEAAVGRLETVLVELARTRRARH